MKKYFNLEAMEATMSAMEIYEEITGIDTSCYPDAYGTNSVKPLRISGQTFYLSDMANGHQWIEVFHQGKMIEIAQDFDMSQEEIKQICEDYVALREESRGEYDGATVVNMDGYTVMITTEDETGSEKYYTKYAGYIEFVGKSERFTEFETVLEMVKKTVDEWNKRA